MLIGYTLSRMGKWQSLVLIMNYCGFVVAIMNSFSCKLSARIRRNSVASRRCPLLVDICPCMCIYCPTPLLIHRKKKTLSFISTNTNNSSDSSLQLPSLSLGIQTDNYGIPGLEPILQPSSHVYENKKKKREVPSCSPRKRNTNTNTPIDGSEMRLQSVSANNGCHKVMSIYEEPPPNPPSRVQAKRSLPFSL